MTKWPVQEQTVRIANKQQDDIQNELYYILLIIYFLLNFIDFI